MTTHKALIVEDDSKAIEQIDEILTALGHEYDRAGSLLEANKCLRTNGYSYVLLDWEIPARPGGTPRIQNAENFMDDLIAVKGSKIPPVVVMMNPGDCKSELALELIRLSASLTKRGAVDFIGKPFVSAGRTLDRVIKKTLHSQSDAVESQCLSGTPDEDEPANRNNYVEIREELDEKPNRKWVTVSEGAELLMDVIPAIDDKKARARVSKAAESQKFRTNGQKGPLRRIDLDSFNTWRFRQRDLDLEKVENEDW